jgi:hypothetical protein
MTPLEAAARAIAKVEGDPEELIEVSAPGGLTRVPAWQLYRVRAKAALDAVRDPIIDALAEDYGPKVEKLREIWRNRIELPR